MKVKTFHKKIFRHPQSALSKKNTCWCDCRCCNAMLQCRPNIQIIFLSRYSPRELLQFIYSPNEYFGKLNLPFQKSYTCLYNCRCCNAMLAFYSWNNLQKIFILGISPNLGPKPSVLPNNRPAGAIVDVVMPCWSAVHPIMWRIQLP